MPFLRPCLKRSLHVRKEDTSASSLSPSACNIVLHYGRERGVMLEDVDAEQLLLLSLLDGQHDFDTILSRLRQRDPAISVEDVSAVLDQLTRFGVLEDAAVLPPAELGPRELERYSRQLHYLSLLDATGTRKYELQARLKQARVAVLGLGGLGANVLLGLAAIGVGFLRGVDFDTVELSNLNRQTLYEDGDIGQPKIEAATRHLARSNPYVTFEAVERKIEHPQDIPDLIQEVDVVAFCADQPRKIRLWMNQVSLETGIPFITGGYRGTVAEIGPFVIPYKTDCLNCFLEGISDGSEIPEMAWVEDTFWLHHPNIHFQTSLAANLICNEIFKYITGSCQPATCNAIYRFDSENFTLEPTSWPTRIPCCSACQREWSPIAAQTQATV